MMKPGVLLPLLITFTQFLHAGEHTLTHGDYSVKLNDSGLSASWKGIPFLSSSRITVSKPQNGGVIYTDAGKSLSGKVTVKGNSILLEDSSPKAGMSLAKQITLDDGGLLITLKIKFAGDPPAYNIFYIAGILPEGPLQNGRYRISRELGISQWKYLPEKKMQQNGPWSLPVNKDVRRLELSGKEILITAEAPPEEIPFQFYDMRAKSSSDIDKKFWIAYSFNSENQERSISTRFSVTQAIPDETPKKGVSIETENGNIPVRGIVFAEKASELEKAAARELQSYIRLMSGTEIPFIEAKAGSPPSGNGWLFIGEVAGKNASTFDENEFKKTGYDSFIVSVKNGNACAAGKNARGTLYAVYRLLETLGCRFFARDLEKIPHPENGVIIAKTLNISDSAVFEWRATHATLEPMKGKLTTGPWPEFVSGTRIPPVMAIPEGARTWHHTMGNLLPANELKESDPDAIALIAGARETYSGNDVIYQQYCLSNPKVADLMKKAVLKWMDKDPERLYYPVHWGDSAEFCECEKCETMYAKLGSKTDMICWFTNQVAKAVAKKYPEKYITTMAYQSTFHAPEKVRLESNLLIIFSPIHACQGRAWSNAINKDVENSLENWIKMHPIGGKGIIAFEYPIIYTYYGVPFPALYAFAKNMRYYHSRGIRGINICGINNWTHLEHLYSYVIPKLLWNPDQELDPLIEEFTEAWYGPAAKPMKEYIDLLHHNAIESKCESIMDGHDTPRQKFFRELYTPEFLTKAYKLFEEAESATDDPVIKNRIAKEKWGLLVADLSLNAAQDIIPISNTSGTVDIPDAKAYRKIAELLAIHKKFERNQDIKESKAWHYLPLSAFTGFKVESSPWWKSPKVTAVINDPESFAKKNIETARENRKRIATIENKAIQVQLVPDIGGRIWRIYSKDYNLDILNRRMIQNGKCDPVKGVNAGGEEELVYDTANLKNERYTMLPGNAPGWTVPYQISERSPDGKSITMTAVLKSGLKITRKVAIADEKAEVMISSRIENISDHIIKDVVLHTHPEFLAQKRHEPCRVDVKNAGGQWKTVPYFNEIILSGKELPNGAWKRISLTGRLCITEEFDPAQVESCCMRANFESFTLELFTKKRNLEPGESIELNHCYTISMD